MDWKRIKPHLRRMDWVGFVPNLVWVGLVWSLEVVNWIGLVWSAGHKRDGVGWIWIGFLPISRLNQDPPLQR